jgi:cell division protein ZapA
MPQVIVEIGGRNYPLSCRDGDEAHLAGLAADIAAKADGLTRSLGPMSESRLLLMAALMVADELHDSRRNGDATRAKPKPAPDSAAQPTEQAAAQPDPATAHLAALVTRAERLADTLGA